MQELIPQISVSVLMSMRMVTLKPSFLLIFVVIVAGWGRIEGIGRLRTEALAVVNPSIGI